MYIQSFNALIISMTVFERCLVLFLAYTTYVLFNIGATQFLAFTFALFVRFIATVRALGLSPTGQLEVIGGGRKASDPSWSCAL